MPANLYRNPLADAVFVFGSNLAGRHGAGAAKFAKLHYGAEYGVGEGPTGRAYALPTKDHNLQSLSLSEVEWHCKQFLDYAGRQRETFFQLTRVGCGLAGLEDKDIAPFFSHAPENVFLPSKWISLNKKLERGRLLVTGRGSVSKDSLFDRLNYNTASWGGRIEVITTMHGDISELAKQWAVSCGYPWTPFPANTFDFGTAADQVLCEQLAWYATHALIINPGVETDPLISILRREHIRCKQEFLEQQVHNEPAMS